MGIKLDLKENFRFVKGDALSLSLISFTPGNGPELPFYWWSIVENDSGREVGKISLRLDHNYHSYWNGNVGYEVNEEFRGRHYAAMALQMVLPIAKAHGMKEIHVTCDEDNAASYKTIERVGGRLLEISFPPKDFIYYQDNGIRKRVYVINL